MDAGSVEVSTPPRENNKGKTRIVALVAAAALLLLVVVIAAVMLSKDGAGGLGASAGPSFRIEGENPALGKPGFGLTGEQMSVYAEPRPGAKYTWDWGDGSAPTTTTNANSHHRYATRGTYNVALSIDGGAPTTRAIRVWDAPKPAIDVVLGGQAATLAGVGPNVAYIGDAVTFSASRTSFDQEHRIVSYHWDFDRHSGAALDAEGVEVANAFPEAGAWIVRLTVTDDLGVERSDDVTLVVGNIIRSEGMVGTGIPPGASQTFTDVLLDVDQSPKRGRGATHVEIVVTWTAGQVPQASDLNLTLLDAAQKVLETAVKSGAETRVTLSYDLGKDDTRGVWTARLARDFPTDVLTTGVATEEVPFTLEARVVYA